MSEFLLHYEKVNPTSWAYLSSLLLIGLFFKFNRFWSVRNLDLVLLILLAPGLLIVQGGNRQMQAVAREAAELRNAAESGITKPANSDDLPPVTDSPSTTSSAKPGAAAKAVERQPEVLAKTAEALAELGGLPSAATKSNPPPLVKSSDSPVPSTNPANPASNAVANATDWKQLQEHELAARNMLWRGYFWLLVVCAVLLARLLFDPTMVRRPLLYPNLSTGGLLFLGGALFFFLMANVITSQVTAGDLSGPKGAEAILSRTDHSSRDEQGEDYSQHGPGYYALHLLPGVITPAYSKEDSPSGDPKYSARVAVAKTMAVIAHLAILAAMVFIGYWHFENIKMGIGAATMYLLLPYTSQMTGHVDHVLPAALLLWAIVLYRRPAVAGALIGLAMSTFYYPFFLLPLWLSFYWQRGVMRFLSGLLVAVGIMVLSLVFVSDNPVSFWLKIQSMFGLWIPKTEGLHGIWALGWDPVYRIPVIAGCVCLGASMAIWPAQKNLGTLLSCSAAIMVAIQFWHGHGDGGGLYLAWFLPLALLTIFRPNLEDRVALTVLGEDWFTRRRAKLAQVRKAA